MVFVLDTRSSVLEILMFLICLFFSHTQCFDLLYYVSSQTKVGPLKQRWKCPCCDKFCPPHELYVDEWFVMRLLDRAKDTDARVRLELLL